MPHFIIDSKIVSDNRICISDKDLYKHIIKVLRFCEGKSILFIDENEFQYECVIKDIQNSSFNCEIVKKYKSFRKLNINLYIAQSVLNSDAQISAVQKATELGVRGIIPLYTDNCSVKEAVIKNKIDKWRKIAFESVKQCERADIPKVFDCSTIQQTVKNFEQVIVFAERFSELNFFEYLRQNPIDKSKDILVIIGPEGGFSQAEFEFFKAGNIPLITLGNLIYRADTALTAGLTTVINGVLYG